MHSADYAVARRLSVCLSVRLYVTRRYCVYTVIHNLNVFHRRVALPYHSSQWRHQDLGPGGHSPSLPFPPLPSSPLEVGPLNPARGSGGAL